MSWDNATANGVPGGAGCGCDIPLLAPDLARAGRTLGRAPPFMLQSGGVVNGQWGTSCLADRRI